MGCAPSTLLAGGKRVPGVVFLDKGAQNESWLRACTATRVTIAALLAAPLTARLPPCAAGAGEAGEAAPQAGKVFKLVVDASSSRRNGDTLILAVRGGLGPRAAAGCRQLPPAVAAFRAHAPGSAPLALPPGRLSHTLPASLVSQLI